MANGYFRERSAPYQPGQTAPFKVSRSKIELYMQCPRCFWLDARLKITRPSSPPFNINKTIDELFKKEFDVHRAAGTQHPIMTAGGLTGIVPFRHMVEARSVDIVMIDVARVGGVTQWMKVAGMAEAFNLPVVSHVMPEILVHMVAACPNGLTVEYMPWTRALYEETPAIEKGQLVLGDGPGLGLKFDEKALTRFKA